MGNVGLMQNLSAEEQLDLSKSIYDLRRSPRMNDRVKAINLGVLLLSVVGEDVLETAVDTLQSDIKEDRMQLENVPQEQPAGGAAASDAGEPTEVSPAANVAAPEGTESEKPPEGELPESNRSG